MLDEELVVAAPSSRLSFGRGGSGSGGLGDFESFVVLLLPITIKIENKFS